MMGALEPAHFRVDPTPEVTTQVLQTIREHEHTIGSLEARIQSLLADVGTLRAEQRTHRQSIARCKGVLTLARRLPEEVLIKIFKQCLAVGWTRAPLVVSHVCSAWRHAAQAPNVWTHIYVQCDDPLALDRTRFWLGMARGSDLHITLVVSYRTSVGILAKAIALLSTRADQWRTLALETDSIIHMSWIVTECKIVAPHLHDIHISTAIAGSPPVGIPPSTEFIPLADAFDESRAPRLATFSFTIDALPARLSLPSHLQHLSLSVMESPLFHPLSTATILAVLQPLAALQTLSLTMPRTYTHPYVPEPDVDRVAALPRLTSLALHGPPDLNGLLPHLYAPSLRKLALRSLDEEGLRGEPIFPSLAGFTARSAPPLELLELHDVDAPPEGFAVLPLQDLRELRLHDSVIGAETLAMVGRRCPRLARLDFRWCGQLQGSALVELVKDRIAAGGRTKIEEVAVINCCFVNEEDVLELARHTVCRLVLREGEEDYCRTRGCCGNARYRTRLRLRHMADLEGAREVGLRLVI